MVLAWAIATGPAARAQGPRWAQLPGPVGGLISLLVAAPSDPLVFYAGNQLAGMFRSEDGGASWTAAAALPILLEALAVDPQRPEVVYAGTSNGGLFKSLHGGRDWVAFPERLTGYVSLLAVEPLQPDRVYAVNDGALYRSESGGRHWTPVGSELGAAIRGLDIDPTSPRQLLAELLDAPGHYALWKSTDPCPARSTRPKGSAG